MVRATGAGVMPDERITLKQAAEEVGVNPASLRQAIRRGRLRAEQEQTPRGAVWYTTHEWLNDYREQRPEWAVRGATIRWEKRADG